MSRLNKPIAIFRHSPIEGPGYFATFLDRHSIPWDLICIDEGAAVPNSVAGLAGLCFMGGPMSVNDDLPWIEPVLELIRAAVTRDVPVIGHCLGGQLIAKALGGQIARNPVKEIGWGTVTPVRNTPEATEWLGDGASFEAFHWHGETFSIPDGATRILASAHCANQAYVLGPHLGMQCHVEMSGDMIRRWCQHWAAEGVPAGPTVQTPEQMLERVATRIAAMQVVADRLYSRWSGGLKR